MYRRILVGCDGTPRDADAIALAQQLSDPDDGTLLLANVFPFYRGLTAPALTLGYLDWLAERANEVLERAAARLDDDVARETHTIAASSAAAGLDELAEQLGADLIVLGVSHHGFPGEVTGRKTVQRLLHGAPCAVATAGPGQARRFEDGGRISVAYDGSPEARLALGAAYEIAAATGAAVQLCGSLEPIVYATGFGGYVDPGLDADRDAALRAELEQAAAEAPDGVETTVTLESGRPAYAVLKAAGPGAALIVAGSRGYGTLHRALAGSTSGALLTDGHVSVLVTPRALVPAGAVG